MALAGIALFLLGTPAKADEVVFAAASSDGYGSLDDDGLYIHGSGIAMPDASAILSGALFSLPSTGDGYLSPDAGIVPFLNGGLSLDDKEGTAIVTTNGSGPLASYVRIDSGGDGQSSAFTGAANAPPAPQ